MSFDGIGAVASYRQDDPAWARLSLGDSPYTMETSGCLTASIASAVSGKEPSLDPGQLKQLFSEEQVYDSEGNLQWDRLKELEGFQAEVYETVSREQIQAVLQEGHFPILRVRQNGLGSFHYVLAVGSREGKLVCMDPLKDKLQELSAYKNRVYALRCVWME